MTLSRGSDELQSSAYWQEQVREDFVVYDPDGWDRKNFEESWAEPITFHEFINRAWHSTVSGAIRKYLK